ncbi:hypothetical protein MKW98_022796 [Papaver atlanticum]|uniref:Coiled-coil domain-containing protein 94 n=1 Tax=Papaver atlanticum TaxID=357466 RepID=A0AAD4TLM7_9MAGN|nr:hypothetical protein MKW98_022796 [Papaver atlanticum]
MVLNTYFPPDFDPTKLPRRSRYCKKLQRVIMKLPVSIWCKNCGNHINRGTKFSSRKEGVAVGETDLGIQISRFHFKCTRCEAELVMKSGPKNSDYIFEFGTTTYFQPLRSEDEVVLKKTKRKDAVEVKDMLVKLKHDAAQKESEKEGEKQLEAQDKKFILYLLVKAPATGGAG